MILEIALAVVGFNVTLLAIILGFRAASLGNAYFRYRKFVEERSFDKIMNLETLVKVIPIKARILSDFKSESVQLLIGFGLAFISIFQVFFWQTDKFGKLFYQYDYFLILTLLLTLIWTFYYTFDYRRRLERFLDEEWKLEGN